MSSTGMTLDPCGTSSGVLLVRSSRSRFEPSGFLRDFLESDKVNGGFGNGLGGSFAASRMGKFSVWILVTSLVGRLR